MNGNSEAGYHAENHREIWERGLFTLLFYSGEFSLPSSGRTVSEWTGRGSPIARCELGGNRVY